jgi:hypothetical protein
MRRCGFLWVPQAAVSNSILDLRTFNLLSLHRYLWQDKRGNYHALHHWQEGTHNKLLNGGHSFSRDGVSTASQCVKTAAEASQHLRKLCDFVLRVTLAVVLRGRARLGFLKHGRLYQKHHLGSASWRK